MVKMGVVRILLPVLVLLAACDVPAPPDAGAATAAPAPAAAEVLPFAELGAFEYVEMAPLPESASKWNGRTVRATGFINPGREVRGLAQFYLVKDRASCCFGQRPKLNHYIDVRLAGGAKTDFTPASPGSTTRARSTRNAATTG